MRVAILAVFFGKRSGKMTFWKQKREMISQAPKKQTVLTIDSFVAVGPRNGAEGTTG